MPRSPASSVRMDVPVLLHEEDVGPRRVQGDAVDAVADLGVRVGNVLRLSPRLIGFHVLPPSSVRKAPAAEMAMYMRLGLVGSSRIVCSPMPPAPGDHFGPVPWPRRPASSCQFFAAVGRTKDRRIFDAGVDHIGVGERRLEMPDAFELPRMLRAVVPLVRGERLPVCGDVS